MNNDDRFKISHIIVPLVLIVLFVAGCCYIVNALIFYEFYWLLLIPCVLSFIVAIFLTFKICIPAIVEEFGKLRKSK